MKFQFQGPEIVLLEHMLIHSCFVSGCTLLLRCHGSWWLKQRPIAFKAIFTIWSFIKKVCQPL